MYWSTETAIGIELNKSNKNKIRKYILDFYKKKKISFEDLKIVKEKLQKDVQWFMENHIINCIVDVNGYRGDLENVKLTEYDTIDFDDDFGDYFFIHDFTKRIPGCEQQSELRGFKTDGTLYIVAPGRCDQKLVKILAKKCNVKITNGQWLGFS